ncbi:hypothetical protein F0562_002306 [Nyssa sinensis]|uniref:Glycosyltransferase n=1 Tax=Nyssa sinensis TaxID=561372 RepID=A0A5J5C994_9ASTE|nr:hypothetical protein F0562_002306 [Nyssa sinensis]
MASAVGEQTNGCHFHVVVLPYPGRGHINPMMNLCKSIASRSNDILITVVLTEEWLGFIGSDSKPANIRFATIPNVLPSELVRGADVMGFIEATQTKMKEPIERLLDQLETPVNLILADIILLWPVKVGNQRNIPVALLWPMSASVFSIYYHFSLDQNLHLTIESAGSRDECVDFIPGISSIRIADLPSNLHQTRNGGIVSLVSKARYLLFPSVYELESQAIDALKPKIPIPVFSFGPAVPYSKLKDTSNGPDYMKWLDSQPTSSVLYISLGSFLSVSSAQMDEIAAGLHLSGVRYLWVARGEASRLKEGCGGSGMVVPFCDQLRVLLHSSVGGFWTHCGWNSTMESVFAGVPLLTFPICIDQSTNSKLIVEDWKIGWKMNREVGMEHLVKREEIALVVQSFMDLQSLDRREMVRRAAELQRICQQAIVKGGSSETNLDNFVKEISQRLDTLACSE